MLLNLLQDEFPLVVEPYLEIAQRLDVSQERILEETRELQEAGIIRQISAIFDSRRLGYRSTLVAMRVKPKEIERAAALIGAHPGVSHNYRREHEFNLWFTLTCPPQADLASEVRRLSQAAGALRVLELPALKTFKIGVSFDLVGAREREWRAPMQRRPRGAAPELSELDRSLVRELQANLPVLPRPFAPTARRLAMDEPRLLAEARRLEDQAIMRRFGAVLRHRQVGFRANAMVCWRIPEARVEEAGRLLASSPEVSHCYQRPTYPDWPYGLFTMLHGRTREECRLTASRMAMAADLQDYVLLFSTREYKKVRVTYFPEGE